MSRNELVKSEPLGSQLLDSVQLLCGAFAGATAAIARNDVSDLEKHIETQETACATLLSLEQDFSLLMKDPRTRHELARVFQNLAREKRSYSRLLSTSAAFHKVMLALCGSYKDAASHNFDPRQNSRGLSCEV